MDVKAIGANLVAEVKRLPWWAWLLIAAGVYLGYRLIASGGKDDGQAQEQQDQNSNGQNGQGDVAPTPPPYQPPGDEPPGDQPPGYQPPPWMGPPVSSPFGTPGTIGYVPGDTTPYGLVPRSSGRGGGPDSHGKPNKPLTHRMRFGESLSSVSDRYGVSADQLYDANRERIDASIQEAGLAGLGVYALPVIGNGLELVIPAAV